MRWTWAAVLTAVAAATPRAVTAAQSARPPASDNGTAAATRPASSSAIGTTVPQLLSALTAPDTPAPARQEAARRLVARQSNESHEALRQVVRSAGSGPARLAAVRALTDDPNPDPALLNDLLAMLADDRLADAASQAAAAYKGNARVIDELSRAALDTRRAAPLRLAAIRALGQIVDPSAAASLAKIVTSPTESGDIVAAAADALVDLTGLEANGRDPAKWAQWQQQKGDRAQIEWERDVLRARSARASRLKRRVDETSTDLQRLLEDSYREAQNKPERLMRYLDADSAEIRRVGVRIADQVATLTPLLNTQEIKDRLVDLIGDADPGVRLAVLKALDNINIDADQALAALLPQLQAENDSNVKAAIARKLGGVNSINQVAALSALLDDPSPGVVQEAAEALRRRAGMILERDPALAKKIAERLRQKMRDLARKSGFLDARRKCGEAVAAFKDRESFSFAQELLIASEPPGIHGVGLQILGELGRQASDIIVSAVDNEGDPSARVQGVRALARTGSFDQSEWLIQKMSPGVETNAEVRAAAKQAYVDLLRSASALKLAGEAQKRKTNPSLRIEVLKELIPKLKDIGDLDGAASERQNLGHEYLYNINPAQPKAAVPLYLEAFDYWRGKGSPRSVTDRLVPELAMAMLRDRQYSPLVTLAQDVIAKSNPGDAKFYQNEFGMQLRKEAERLRDARDVENASALIDAAMKMDSLTSVSREDLDRIRGEVEDLKRQGVGRKPAVR